MKTIYSFFLLCIGFSGFSQIINIPDANFKGKLLLANSNNTFAKNSSGQYIKIDTNNNGEIEVTEAQAVAYLNVSSAPNNAISDIETMEGLQYFTNLTELRSWGNTYTSLDVSMLTQLVILDCSSGLMSSLNVSGLTNLQKLYCYYNQLPILNVSGLTALENLWCMHNNLTFLDCSGLSALKAVMAYNNQLTSVTFTSHPSLDYVDLGYNNLSTVDLSTLTILAQLDISFNNLSSLNLQPFSTTLSSLNCSFNPISTLQLNGFTALGILNVNGTLITTLDCSQTGLQQLVCRDNPNLQTINIRNGYVGYNDPDLLFFSVNIENNPQLISICVDNGEQNNLIYYNYNTSGSVVVYTGINCDIPVPKTMGINDYNKGNLFAVYPNPTTSYLNIKMVNDISVNEIAVYNTLGQKVITKNNETTLDVSTLNTGTYFITVTTDAGKATRKFIKL